MGAAPLLGALVAERGAMAAVVVTGAVAVAVAVVVVSTAWTDSAARATNTVAHKMKGWAEILGMLLDAALTAGINTSGRCAV